MSVCGFFILVWRVWVLLEMFVTTVAQAHFDFLILLWWWLVTGGGQPVYKKQHPFHRDSGCGVSENKARPLDIVVFVFL